MGRDSNSGLTVCGLVRERQAKSQQAIGIRAVPPVGRITAAYLFRLLSSNALASAGAITRSYTDASKSSGLS
jgi:hypothetical protein